MKHVVTAICLSIMTAWGFELRAVSARVVAPGVGSYDPRAAIAEEVRVEILKALEESDLALQRYAEDLAQNPELIKQMTSDQRAMAQGQVTLMRTIIAAAKTNDTTLMNESELRTLLEMNRDVLKQAVRHKRSLFAGKPFPDSKGLQNRSYQKLPTSIEDLLKLLADVRIELNDFVNLKMRRAESLLGQVGDFFEAVPYATIADRAWPYLLLGVYCIYATAPDKLEKSGFAWLMPIKRLVGGVKGSKPVVSLTLAVDGTGKLPSPEQIKNIESSFDFEKKTEIDKSAPLSRLFNFFSVKLDPKESLVTIAVMGTVKNRIFEDGRSIFSYCKSFFSKPVMPIKKIAAPGTVPLSEDARTAECISFCKSLCIEPESMRVSEVVAMTEGCSQADLSAVFARARAKAQDQKVALGYTHLEEAIDTLVRHIDTSKFPRDAQRAACARAGEALCIALLRDGTISKVTIHPVMNNGVVSDGGIFIESTGLRDRASLSRACMRALAGLAAHDVLGIEPSFELVISAKREAFDAAYLLVCEGASDNQLTKARREAAKNEAWERVEHAYQMVRDLLVQNKEVLEGISDRLMRYGSIDRAMLADIMQSIE